MQLVLTFITVLTGITLITFVTVYHRFNQYHPHHLCHRFSRFHPYHLCFLNRIIVTLKFLLGHTGARHRSSTGQAPVKRRSRCKTHLVLTFITVLTSITLITFVTVLAGITLITFVSSIELS